MSVCRSKELVKLRVGVSFNAMIDEVRNHRYELEAMVDSRTKVLEIHKKLEDTSAQLRASYEAARDGIIVVGVEGNFIAANQRVIDLFQMSEDLGLNNVVDFAEGVKSKFSKPSQFISSWTKINNDDSQVREVE